MSVGSSNNAGLMFRVSGFVSKSDWDGYYVGLTYGLSDTGSIKLYRCTGGDGDYEIGTAAITVTANTFYHVKVVANGTNIKAYFTDMSTAKINVTNTSYSTGQIGVRSYYNNSFRVDNINDMLPLKQQGMQPEIIM